MLLLSSLFFFFFNATATTEIYTLSLHDALPILPQRSQARAGSPGSRARRVSQVGQRKLTVGMVRMTRSEEHTSELQSLTNLVCRLLLEKKKKKKTKSNTHITQLEKRNLNDSRSI